MDPVLVLIKRKARIGFWKNHKWRHDTGFPGGINVWVNHALLTTMGLSQSSRLDFFLSPVPFSKIYQFLTFAHSENTKSKENLCPHHPPQDLIQWLSALRYSRQTVPLNVSTAERETPAPICTSQLCWPNNPAQTHQRVGRQPKLFHCASIRPGWRGKFSWTKLSKPQNVSIGPVSAARGIAAVSAGRLTESATACVQCICHVCHPLNQLFWQPICARRLEPWTLWSKRARILLVNHRTRCQVQCEHRRKKCRQMEEKENLKRRQRVKESV